MNIVKATERFEGFLAQHGEMLRENLRAEAPADGGRGIRIFAGDVLSVGAIISGDLR